MNTKVPWPSPNPDYEAAVKGAVLGMPAAKLLGFNFGRMAPGEAEIIQPYRTELTELTGHIQGGVLGSLADFAGGSAAGTLLPAGWVNMTIDFTVKILAPAKGDEIIARGRVIKANLSTTTATANVYARRGADEESLCATALVTMRNIKVANR
ncbi:hypothetical protein MSIMFI_00859 [Mycobacterium simulans]|uniref:PaaI family thioesterase n=1 Tax=Mycobacterium simulans TaxID=627089 RepID=UPI00174B8EAE|nr:PaaI family thioesterase [Mycobacterium simulans]SON59376.1 hypothetical protein MSIMFI_00859 [Mycobacterium simulans]